MFDYESQLVYLYLGYRCRNSKSWLRLGLRILELGVFTKFRPALKTSKHACSGRLILYFSRFFPRNLCVLPSASHMDFPPGKYIIINALHRTFACLPTSDHEQYIVGIIEPNSENHQVSCQWLIVSSPMEGGLSICSGL